MSEPIEIELGDTGLIAWIDEEDSDIISMGWAAKRAGYAPNFHYYAVSRQKMGNQMIEYYLHNMIWERMVDAPLPDGYLVDHINGDKLDNRRINLRMATRGENEANKRKRRTHGGGATTSRYKGVSKVNDGREKKWRVTIAVNKRKIHLGSYYTEIEAARAYNEAAKEHYGEFALLNDIPDEETDGTST